MLRVLELPEGDEEVAVVGTVYKEMALKPSILDEYVKERGVGAQLGRARFTSPDDKVCVCVGGGGVPHEVAGASATHPTSRSRLVALAFDRCEMPPLAHAHNPLTQ